jgi:ABC-type nitrate/sulfonate/bicarbonate transport system substrate-binding protein
MKPSAHCISVIVLLVFLIVGSRESLSQIKPTSVGVAYSALSAGIGVLWLTHEQGIFRKYGLESNLVYMRSGTTAAQALLAGEIQFGHLSPAPMMTAWAQGADTAWVGTTIHQMVFTLITDATITKAADLKAKKLGITRIGSASDLALRTVLEHLGLGIKDVAVISMGGIPDILAGMKAGAVNGGILSPPTSTTARDLGYRPLVHIPDLGKEFTFSGYKEYDAAISSPPYPSLKALEAVRDSLVDSAPQLKQIDLRMFIDDRFVKPR